MSNLSDRGHLADHWSLTTSHIGHWFLLLTKDESLLQKSMESFRRTPESWFFSNFRTPARAGVNEPEDFAGGSREIESS
jgi:hypothetical protein